MRPAAAVAVVLLAVVLALLPQVCWADAQVPVATLDDNPLSTPELAMDAEGGAVVAWVGFQRTVSGDGQTTYVDAVKTSVRPAGGTFGPSRALSSLRSDVTREVALAVGRAGQAVIAWRPQDEQNTDPPMVVSRRENGGDFGAPVAVPRSGGGRGATVAVGGDGSILVAWTGGSGRRGCGSVVWAVRARAERPFGDAVRVSDPCANASMPRAALGPDGRGAVAWRSRAGGVAQVRAAAFRQGRFATDRAVSRTPVSAVDFDLVGDRTGATVAWRDATGTGEARRNRVLAARVAGGLRPRPRVVTSAVSLAGPPRLAANAAGAAVATWEEAPAGRPAYRPAVYAARRPTIGGRFGRPQLVAQCGAADASQTYARPSIDAAGTAVVAFQTACGPDLGLGPNLAVAAARGSRSGVWGAPTPLSSGGYAVGVQVAGPDAGGAVVAWTERSFGAPQAIEGLRVAILS